MEYLISAAKNALKVLGADTPEAKELKNALQGCGEPTYVDQNGLSIPHGHRVQLLERKIAVEVVIRSVYPVSMEQLGALIQQKFEVLDATKVKETIVARDLQIVVNW